MGEYTTTTQTMPSGNIFMGNGRNIVAPERLKPSWMIWYKWMSKWPDINYVFFFLNILNSEIIFVKHDEDHMKKKKTAKQSNLCVIWTIYQAFSFLHFYVMAIRPRDGNANILYEIQTGVSFVQNYKSSIDNFGTAIPDQSPAIVNSSWNID